MSLLFATKESTGETICINDIDKNYQRKYKDVYKDDDGIIVIPVIPTENIIRHFRYPKNYKGGGGGGGGGKESNEHKLGKRIVRDYLPRIRFLPCTKCSKNYITYQNHLTIEENSWEYKKKGYKFFDVGIIENGKPIASVEIIKCSEVSKHKEDMMKEANIKLHEVKAFHIIEHCYGTIDVDRIIQEKLEMINEYIEIRPYITNYCDECVEKRRKAEEKRRLEEEKRILEEEKRRARQEQEKKRIEEQERIKKEENDKIRKLKLKMQNEKREKKLKKYREKIRKEKIRLDIINKMNERNNRIMKRVHMFIDNVKYSLIIKRKIFNDNLILFEKIIRDLDRQEEWKILQEQKRIEKQYQDKFVGLYNRLNPRSFKCIPIHKSKTYEIEDYCKSSGKCKICGEWIKDLIEMNEWSEKRSKYESPFHRWVSENREYLDIEMSKSQWKN